MSNNELNNTLTNYVNTYNDVILFIEKEIHKVISPEFYKMGCEVGSINQIALHVKFSGKYYTLEHNGLPDKSWAPLCGQGFVINLYDSNTGKEKSVSAIYNFTHNRWDFDVDVENFFNLNMVFELTYIDIVKKVVAMLKKDFAEGDQKVEKAMIELFEYHKKIIELNKSN